jgi:hypothetical protein
VSGSSSRRYEIAAVVATLLASVPALAGPADVVLAEASCRGEVCDFRVTVRHEDAGWKHYADGFEVLGQEGEVLGTRVLRHPHLDEQPFTRDLSGVKVPKEITRVRIRAHDSVHGHGGEERVVELERPEAAE